MAKPAPSLLVVIAICKAAPGQEKTLRAAQEKLVIDTLKEPGCIRYELNQSLDDPAVLIFTEIWETEKSWKDHMEGAAMKRFQASGASQLFADFTLHRMTLVPDERSETHAQRRIDATKFS